MRRQGKYSLELLYFVILHACSALSHKIWEYMPVSAAAAYNSGREIRGDNRQTV